MTQKCSRKGILGEATLTLLVDAKVQLAQQLGLAGGLVVDRELLSGRQLPLTQVTCEAGQVVDRRGSLSDPVRRRDQAKAFGTFDRVTDQLGVVLATVDAAVFDETRLLLTQQVIALRTPDKRPGKGMIKGVLGCSLLKCFPFGREVRSHGPRTERKGCQTDLRQSRCHL